MAAGDRSLHIAAVAVVAAAGTAVYAPSLWFPPITRDELLLLSSVANAPHPFGYFAGDWGLGNHMYRPLFTTTLWGLYRWFGVWSLPNQLLSLILHVTVIGLLFGTISRANRPRQIAFSLLLALMALISAYTMSGAMWTVDRPTVMVALCLMLAVRELMTDRPRPWLLVLLSVAALLSKESGIVVPLLVMADSWMERRQRLITIGVVMVVAYVLLRVMLFGGRAVTYPESGVLLGIWPYVDSSQLSWRQHVLTLIDTPIRHVVATVVPVFGDEGANPSLATLWETAWLWLPTAGLFVLALGRPTRMQRLAIAIVLLNALAHFALFRTRNLYLAQLAFVLYVAGSPSILTVARRRLAVVMLLVLLSWSVMQITREVKDESARRDAALTDDAARDFKLEDEAAIDRRLMDAVVQQYRGR